MGKGSGGTRTSSSRKKGRNEAAFGQEYVEDVTALITGALGNVQSAGIKIGLYKTDHPNWTVNDPKLISLENRWEKYKREYNKAYDEYVKVYSDVATRKKYKMKPINFRDKFQL